MLTACFQVKNTEIISLINKLTERIGPRSDVSYVDGLAPAFSL